MAEVPLCDLSFLFELRWWLAKKIYGIPYDTSDSADQPESKPPEEDQTTWIEEPSEAEPLYHFFGILLISPESTAPLDDGRRIVDQLPRIPYAFRVADYQFGRPDTGLLRFADIKALPPLYLTVDEDRTIANWETFLPDRVPCSRRMPKQEEGVSDAEYRIVFGQFLEENAVRWMSRLREMARTFPRHFVVLLDVADVCKGSIRFIYQIDLKP